MKLNNIYEGWKNHLFPPEKMKEVILNMSEERLAICNDCPSHSENKENYSSIRKDKHCTECGCTLVAKTKSFSSSCPLDKWQAVMTPIQESEIRKSYGRTN